MRSPREGSPDSNRETAPTLDPAPPGAEVGALVEHLFRHRSGELVAALSRHFGPANLDLAEEVVQDALVTALRQWPFRGVPGDPAGWLYRVARNRAIDLLRRDARIAARGIDASAQLEALARRDADAFAHDLADDQLRLIFLCCHPDLPRPSQVALALKTLGGFGVPELARAFLAREDAVAQRLVRARRTLAESAGPLDALDAPDLDARLDAALEVVYLMFNEGYSAHRGEDLVRLDLCAEAVRLGLLLAAHPRTDRPKTHALAALLLLQASRLPARVDGQGDLLTLPDQDRSLWDRRLIARGFFHLDRACAGGELTAYHAQAAIASLHARADSDAATDWAGILAHYDSLMAIAPDPLVALNRAVALGRVRGPLEALDALDALDDAPELSGYHLRPATRGTLLRELGRLAEAAACFERALDLAGSEPERRFLRRQLNRCRTG